MNLTLFGYGFKGRQIRVGEQPPHDPRIQLHPFLHRRRRLVVQQLPGGQNCSPRQRKDGGHGVVDQLVQLLRRGRDGVEQAPLQSLGRGDGPAEQ